MYIIDVSAVVTVTATLSCLFVRGIHAVYNCIPVADLPLEILRILFETKCH